MTGSRLYNFEFTSFELAMQIIVAELKAFFLCEIGEEKNLVEVNIRPLFNLFSLVFQNT